MSLPRNIAPQGRQLGEEGTPEYLQDTLGTTLLGFGSNACTSFRAWWETKLEDFAGEN